MRIATYNKVCGVVEKYIYDGDWLKEHRCTQADESWECWKFDREGFCIKYETSKAYCATTTYDGTGNIVAERYINKNVLHIKYHNIDTSLQHTEEVTYHANGNPETCTRRCGGSWVLA